jgi:hypothetical protein
MVGGPDGCCSPFCRRRCPQPWEQENRCCRLRPRPHLAGSSAASTRARCDGRSGECRKFRCASAQMPRAAMQGGSKWANCQSSTSSVLLEKSQWCRQRCRIPSGRTQSHRCTCAESRNDGRSAKGAHVPYRLNFSSLRAVSMRHCTPTNPSCTSMQSARWSALKTKSTYSQLDDTGGRATELQARCQRALCTRKLH